MLRRLARTVLTLSAALVVGGAWVDAVAAGPGPAEPAQRLDPLVVTGTRTAQRLSETPIRTEVLGARELGLSAARTFADAIELLPGARVENNCQNCGTSEVLLLGLEQKYTQLLFDGVPLFSGLASVYGIDQIPTLFVDRIEVVKGGGSAMYGSGAVGGVINLIARRPAQSGGVVEARGDRVGGASATTFGAVLDQVAPDNRWLFSAYGQTSRADPVDLNADGFSDLTRKRLHVAGFRHVHRVGPGELRLEYGRTEEFRRGGNRFELVDHLADISERIDTRRDAATVSWSVSRRDDWDGQVVAGFARIDRQTFYGGLFGRGADEALVPESSLGAGDNDQAFLDRGYRRVGEVAQDQYGFTKNWVWSLDTQFNREFGPHLLSVGAQYYRERITDLVPVSSFVTEYPIVGDDVSGDSVAVFAQDQWRLNERWTFVAGVRADRNSELERPVVSPRLNLKWQASRELVLRATYATGFRAPQPFDEDLHIELIAGDRTKTRQAKELGPEKSRSMLLSAEYKPEFADGRLAIESTLFLTRIRGTFANSQVKIDPVGSEAFRERYNGPDAHVGGVELNIGALPRPNLRLDFGLVAQVARFKRAVTIFDDGAGTLVEERDFLETPRRYAVVQVTYLQPRFADVVLNATYTGHMKQINQRIGVLNARTRDFLVWNATLSRRFPLTRTTGVVASGGVRNLFDSRQSDLESGPDRDPYYLYGPRTPRTYFVSAKVEF